MRSAAQSCSTTAPATSSSAPSGYKVPDDITHALTEPAVGARNGLTKLGAMFYINPQDWQRNARLVGETTIAGETVQHIKADISPQAFFLDVSRMVRALSRLRVPQALGLPTELGPKLRAALARSVTVAEGEAWIGKDDHVLRKARAHGKLVVAERIATCSTGSARRRSRRTSTCRRSASAHTIDAPRSLGSYSSLQLALSALAEAARKDADRR